MRERERGDEYGNSKGRMEREEGGREEKNKFSFIKVYTASIKVTPQFRARQLLERKKKKK